MKKNKLRTENRLLKETPVHFGYKDLLQLGQFHQTNKYDLIFEG